MTTPAVEAIPFNQNAAVGIDVYGTDRARGATVPPFRGQSVINVRAVDRANRMAELTGATCTLRTDTYSATVTTPGRVVVPNYGAQSPVITATCSDGTRQASTTTSVTNVSAEERASATTFETTPALGVLVGTIVSPSTDTYAYDDIRVTFR
ncbi:hypothetical protein AAD018_014720 [Aestuariibius insulae]|uniref:hypothetical protein n=1 Tax=Aestuariibius insulae TaxID=2058287 RepID=UPI00398EE06A